MASSPRGRVDGCYRVNGMILPSMTMILTAVLPRYIVQVSDRKLTWSINGQVVLQEDRWNKATVFVDKATIAFAGPARLPIERTDQWIAETISATTTVDEALELLWEGATERLARGEWNPPGLAIVCARWKEIDGVLLPGRTVITDYMDQGGAAGRLRDHFYVLDSTQIEPGLSLYAAGQPLPFDKVRTLGRRIKAAYEHGVSMRLIAEIVVSVMRDLRNPLVGESFNAVVLPKPLLGRPVQALLDTVRQGPNLTAPTVYYFAGPSAAAEYVLPNLVGGGLAVTDITVHARAMTAEEVAARYRAGRPLPRHL